MNASVKIWTLDARDSVLLEAMTAEFGLSDAQVRSEVVRALEFVTERLRAKGVEYADLRNALVPRRDRNEIGLLFDSEQIDSSWYGYPIAEQIVPLLDRDLLCSIRSGDLIRDDQRAAFDLLARHLVMHKDLDLSHTSQVYCVYLNNLSDQMVENLVSSLRTYPPFVGYVDVSTSSKMKDWLSVILVSTYLKARNVVLNGDDGDISDSEDRNMAGWPWEEHGYACRSFTDDYFHLFLNYKIERRVIPGFESDTRFGLAAISDEPMQIEGIPVLLESAKAEYLLTAHREGLERAGLAQLTNEEIADRIRSKISASYIYELTYRSEFDLSFFNLMLEIDEPKGQAVTRLVANLEYDPKEPKLRVVTLY